MQKKMTYSLNQLKKAMLFSLIGGIVIGVFFTKISTQNKLIEQMVAKEAQKPELTEEQKATKARMEGPAFQDVVLGDERKY